jgi:hypothetical protein
MDAEFTALDASGVMGPTNAAGSAESKYLGKTVGTAAAPNSRRPKTPPRYSPS